VEKVVCVYCVFVEIGCGEADLKLHFIIHSQWLCFVFACGVAEVHHAFIIAACLLAEM
jgi:hypothetical protein